MAYNLVYSLGQHAYDADCRLFLAVFAGECGEGVRREQAQLQDEVGPARGAGSCVGSGNGRAGGTLSDASQHGCC